MIVTGLEVNFLQTCKMQVVLEVASQVYIFSEMLGNKSFSNRNLRKKVNVVDKDCCNKALSCHTLNKLLSWTKKVVMSWQPLAISFMYLII